MPVSEGLPHRWYETPNIHLATLADLEELFAEHDLVVHQRVLLHGDGQRRSRGGPANLMAAGAVYEVGRGSVRE
jgi:hypothetical protein